jgi:predicted permease
MKLLAYLRSTARKFFRYSQVEDDMEDELLSHIQHRADDLEHCGLSREEAERRARIEFGGYEKFRQESHEALGGNFFESFLQDARYSIRRLRKSLAFAITAVLTLALAIGANAVVFSVLNAFILRPLNVTHSDNLFMLWNDREEDGQQSYPDYLDLRDRNRSFEDLMAYAIAQPGLDTDGNPSHTWALETTGNYFDALGLQPHLGHFFHTSDEHGPNSAPSIVLTYAFWRSHFQGDRNVVGRVVQVNKHPFTIIGVAPPEFRGTLIFFNPDFFTPIVNHELVGGENNLNARGARWVFMAMGHLKPGVTQAQAIADLNAIGSDLAKTYPKDDSKMTAFSLERPSLYGRFLGPPVLAFLTALLLLSGLILLAACANLGALFAARTADNEREIALRLALGSSRSRILRGLFTEALLIACAGGAIGLAGSVMLLRWLSTWQPIARWPLQMPVTPDANVYAVALLLTLASGLLFGAVPVKQILRTNPYEIVKSGSAGRLGRRVTVRDALLVVQIAICAVLVTSSIVAIRGLARSLHSNFGFDLQHSMIADTDLSIAGYGGDELAATQRRIFNTLQSAPGVEAVALASAVPLGEGTDDSDVFTDSTSDLRPSNAATNALIYRISPGYFRAAGTALLLGRAFTWHDEKNAPRVAVINLEFAKKIFGSVNNAIGGHYKLPDGTRIEVVGIAEDGKYASLTENPRRVMFLPLLQSPSHQTYILVRSGRDPQQMAVAIRSTLHNLDPGLPFTIQTRYKELDAHFFAPRMATMSLGVMGIIGGMLSITGIFGMAAYSVSKRLKELGIRVALGAQRKQVLQAALGSAFRLLTVGSVAGLVLGLLASRVLELVVYQATPRDPLVLAGAVLAMLLLGLVATWIPAQRALAVNPLILLREE